MGFAEKTVAWLIAIACIAMLLRMALGAKRRQKLDSTALSFWQTVKRRSARMYRRQATKKEARKATQEILQRMRQPVERHGNVISPKAFKRSDKQPDRNDDEA